MSALRQLAHIDAGLRTMQATAPQLSGMICSCAAKVRMTELRGQLSKFSTSSSVKKIAWSKIRGLEYYVALLPGLSRSSNTISAHRDKIQRYLKESGLLISKLSVECRVLSVGSYLNSNHLPSIFLPPVSIILREHIRTSIICMNCSIH